MKDFLKRLYDVPLLGYLLRWGVGLVKLPIALRAFDQALRTLHALQQHADQRLSEQQAQLAATIELVRRFQVEALGTARIADDKSSRLEIAQGELARQIADCASQIQLARAGFDQHVPTLLNLVASHAAASRLLRRDHESVGASVDALLVRARALEENVGAVRNSLAGIERRAEEGVGAVRNSLAGLERRADEGVGAVRNSLADLERRAAVLFASNGELGQKIDQLGGKLSNHEKRLESADAARSAANPLAADIADLRSHVGYLLNRVEFVRRETLFELRYGKAPAKANPKETEPRVLNKAKLAAAMKRGLMVNVGCGHIAMDGYINVDRRELPGVDVIAEADRMPFQPGSVTELFSAHLLEHFPREQLRREVLPYWKSLLAPKGILRSVVPDAVTMMQKFHQGEIPFEDLREVTYGAQDYDGDFHYNMFNMESLSALLKEAGFGKIEFPVVGRRNGQCFEMEFVAQP